MKMGHDENLRHIHYGFPGPSPIRPGWIGRKIPVGTPQVEASDRDWLRPAPQKPAQVFPPEEEPFLL